MFWRAPGGSHWANQRCMMAWPLRTPEWAKSDQEGTPTFATPSRPRAAVERWRGAALCLCDIVVSLIGVAIDETQEREEGEEGKGGGEEEGREGSTNFTRARLPPAPSGIERGGEEEEGEGRGKPSIDGLACGDLLRAPPHCVDGWTDPVESPPHAATTIAPPQRSHHPPPISLGHPTPALPTEMATGPPPRRRGLRHL